jgi:hypothetical protein
MKNLLGAAAIIAVGMFAVSGTANAAPVAPDAAGLATLAQTGGTELVHWRPFRHCHGRGYRRYCHGGFRRHHRHHRRHHYRRYR